MHKQRFKEICVQFFDVTLSDEFPVSFFYYTQKEQDLHNLHHHNSFEIGICLEGSGAFFIENKAITFHVGDISFIYPNQPHIAQSPSELPSRWIFINVDINGLLHESNALVNGLWEQRNLIPPIVHPNCCPNLADIAKIMVKELELKEQNYQVAVKELLGAFIIKLLRLQREKANDPPISSGDYVSIMPALAFIAQNYQREIAICNLAHICNFSETHFRVVFKKAMGRTPKQYLSYIRMKMARTLLKSTNKSILVISQSVGYDSISSFYRAFYAMYNQTPSAYKHEDS